MKVVFFGTPFFAAEVLQFLLNNQVNVVAVVSKPDRPKGRSGTPLPTPVKLVALNHQPPIPLFQPERVSDPESTDLLKAFNADLFVVVAYGEIIKQNLLDMPCLGCINLHASLLPHYRGAAPIQRAIIDGNIETGVTIMHMVRKMDAGDMIEVAKVPIGPETTYGELEQSLCDIGQVVLLKVIRQFESGVPVSIPQDHSQMTLAPKIELEDCEVNWTQSAQSIHDLVRGVNPHPGAWCWVSVKGEKKRLKINRTRIVPYPHETPGKVLNSDQKNVNLIIATESQAIELLEVQLEGKKMMSSAELCRGISPKSLLF